jgi:hypothetical protein
MVFTATTFGNVKSNKPHIRVLKFPLWNVPVSNSTGLTKCNIKIIPSKQLLWLLSQFHTH